MSTASRRFKPNRRACWRKSLEVSTITVWPACSISTETRKRLSRESSEVHVSHSQAIEGTPVDVPVPRKVSFILAQKKPRIVHSSFDIFHWPFADPIRVASWILWVAKAEERSTKLHERTR